MHRKYFLGIVNLDSTAKSRFLGKSEVVFPTYQGKELVSDMNTHFNCLI